MWVPLLAANLEKNWSFSPPTEASKFRLSYRNFARIYARGLISQASMSHPPEFTSFRRLYPKFEIQVFEFVKPVEFERRRLAVRGVLLPPTPVFLLIDYWSAPSPAIATYSIPYSESPVRLAAGNFSRKEIVIRNNSDRDLYVTLGDSASIDGYFVCLPRDAVAGLPESWRGTVTGLWDEGGTGSAEVQEFR
jgi:hypothetical protein